jgi:hypothetical protein
MTLEGWVQYDSLSGAGSVIGGFGPPDGTEYLLGNTESSPKSAVFVISTPSTNAVQGPILTTGAWTHLAGTYDGATLRLYVNGALVASTAKTGNVFDVTELRLCRHPRNIGFFLDGTIDEVRIWNVARTSQQIHDNYLHALAGDEPGLVGYYRFDEGAGQVVVDSSSAGNDGFLGAGASAGVDDPERVVSGAPLAEPGPCVRDAGTACLLEGRFEVRARMRDFANPPVIFPGVIQTYDGASSETDQTVSFYSFQNGNVEVFVKMVGACGNPNFVSFWVFAAGATDAETLITVRDSFSGEIYSIYNPPHHVFSAVADTLAFKTCAF